MERQGKTKQRNRGWRQHSAALQWLAAGSTGSMWVGKGSNILSDYSMVAVLVAAAAVTSVQGRQGETFSEKKNCSRHIPG